MQASTLKYEDITELEKHLIKYGKIIPVPYKFLQTFKKEQLATFAHKYAIYQFPTIELLQFITSEIGDHKQTIEIGAGNGCFGRNLGIRMVDNYNQEMPQVKEYYDLMGQPTIKYGKDVENIGGNEAVLKYKPKTVLACWVTDKWDNATRQGNYWGVKEEDLFNNGVKKYIHCGNDGTHFVKPILKKIKHKKHYFPWLITRSLSTEANSIYIFEP